MGNLSQKEIEEKKISLVTCIEHQLNVNLEVFYREVTFGTMEEETLSDKRDMRKEI